MQWKHFLAALILAFAMGATAQTAGAQLAAGVPMVLPTEKMTVKTGQGSFEFEVEIADEGFEQARGLMYRKEMPVRRGMLFDFGTSREVAMWMKNTYLPLDMVFARKDGTVVRIAERTEPLSEATIASGEPVTHVLELNAGVAKMIGLKPGDKLMHRLFAN